MKRVGVLALQGDFETHGKALARAGALPVYIRHAAELADIDGLILPGGESTTMLKILKEQKLFDPLREFGKQKPMFGTCAGVILMATEVANPIQDSLGLLDMAVTRNGYGRQIDSRIADIALDGEHMEAVFIRAPVIERVGPNAKVLSEYQGHPVLVECGQHLAATFHPELSSGTRVQELFLGKL